MWYGRTSEEYTEPLPKLLEDYFEERVNDGYDTVIIGHYHRAVRHEIQRSGQIKRFFALGDRVSQCTYLLYDGTF